MELTHYPSRFSRNPNLSNPLTGIKWCKLRNKRPNNHVMRGILVLCFPKTTKNHHSPCHKHLKKAFNLSSKHFHSNFLNQHNNYRCLNLISSVRRYSRHLMSPLTTTALITYITQMRNLRSCILGVIWSPKAWLFRWFVHCSKDNISPSLASSLTSKLWKWSMTILA